MADASEQVRVLVVSPSAYVRYVISGELSSEPGLFVVGTAQTPDEIAAKQALLRPDVAVVDLESPRDFPNLRRALEGAKPPVLVLCSLSQGSAELADSALAEGAADVVVRSEGANGNVVFVPDLSHTVRGMVRLSARRGE